MVAGNLTELELLCDFKRVAGTERWCLVLLTVAVGYQLG